VAARSIAIALLALVFVHQSDATEQGTAIFRRAEGSALSEAHARYATYTVTVAFDDGSRHVTHTWETSEDLTHSVVFASIFSREERADPATPRGSNLKFGASLGSGGTPASYASRPVNAEQTDDPIGPVAFAVDQTFGLTPPRTYGVTHDVRSFDAAGDGIATIGRTLRDAERYRVALLDQTGGVEHLALTPLRDAYHNRLRELWVDELTATIREAIVQGVADRAPLDRIRWDVTFVQSAGSTYVSDEHALEPVVYGRGRILRDVHVRFADLTFGATLPFRYTFGVGTPIDAVHDP
jgi:hypothetical protein